MGKKLQAERLLEKFMFSREHQRVYFAKLSGGEKRRLYLLTVLMKNPEFLIFLDEPTNDLDLLTLNVLEEYLLEFKGSVLMVTHDRFFMDKIVDHILVFSENGRSQRFSQVRIQNIVG